MTHNEVEQNSVYLDQMVDVGLIWIFISFAEHSTNLIANKEPVISGEEATRFEPEPADSQLLTLLKANGEDELAKYFMENRERLHRMIEMRLDRRLTQRVDASDVLQEGFVDAAKRLQEYIDDPTMPLFIWIRFLVGQKLAAIHRWHFNTQKRDPRREEMGPSQKPPAVDSQILAQEFSASMTSPSEAVSKAELMKKMLEFLEQLDPMDREILVMRHFEEMSNNEAAYELGLTKGTASKRYVRALAKLNKAMASAGTSIPSQQE